MKVLLAPLFFRSRFCKHCAGIFYKENPGAWLGLWEFESLPPLGSFESTRGFVPDYPALMMFDEFVVDGEALDRIKHPGGRDWLGEWPDLVGALSAEGALTVADVGAAARAHPHRRGAMLKSDLREPERWWQSMAYYESLTAQAQELLGDSPETARDVGWSFDPDQTFGAIGSDGHVHNLAVVLAESKTATLPAHQELFAQALNQARGQLREVNACLTACNELQVAPMMWAPYRRYMEQKLHQSSEVNAEGASREFFEIAFPAYAPSTVCEFVRLRADKRLAALRSEISRASESGDSLDKDYPQRVLTDVLRIQTKAARTRRILGWIATAIGVIPVPGLGVAASVAAEGASAIVEHRRQKPWRWFYLISDGRGLT